MASPDWSNMLPDILEKIFETLPVADMLRFKWVCAPWRALGQAQIKSALSHPIPESPLLLLPGQHWNGYGGLMQDLHKVTEPIQIPTESHTVGSSCGWLLLVKEITDLTLWNPMFDLQIHLPSLLTFSSGKKAFFDDQHWVSKVLLCGSDPIASGNYCVVVMYGFKSKLAFASCGDSKWRKLENTNCCADITCFNDSLLALSFDGKVELWNFENSIPIKTMEIALSFPMHTLDFEPSLWDKYEKQFYVVQDTNDAILLVVRWIGRFVNPQDGELYTEAELMEAEENDDFLVCPYMTQMFYVYKLDLGEGKWVPMEDIGNQALFVGGNQSVSLAAKDFPECQKNSIYFTDDFWERIDENDCYGGHDLGVYSLEDGSIKAIYDCGWECISPPFWILPHTS